MSKHEFHMAMATLAGLGVLDFMPERTEPNELKSKSIAEIAELTAKREAKLKRRAKQAERNKP